MEPGRHIGSNFRVLLGVDTFATNGVFVDERSNIVFERQTQSFDEVDKKKPLDSFSQRWFWNFDLHCFGLWSLVFVLGLWSLVFGLWSLVFKTLLRVRIRSIARFKGLRPKAQGHQPMAGFPFGKLTSRIFRRCVFKLKSLERELIRASRNPVIAKPSKP